MTDRFQIRAHVRTTVDAPGAWPGAWGAPAGSLGTIETVFARGGYGVLLNDDPDQLGAHYSETELAPTHADA